MTAEVFIWNGTGSYRVVAEHAHVHLNGECIKNREGVACTAPTASWPAVLNAPRPWSSTDSGMWLLQQAEGSVGEAAISYASLAQAHLTLALVEAQTAANEIAERLEAQHRIANILALVGDEDPETVDANLREFGLDPATVRDDIRTALGWS